LSSKIEPTEEKQNHPRRKEKAVDTYRFLSLTRTLFKLDSLDLKEHDPQPQHILPAQQAEYTPSQPEQHR
jgi:hypothetical protein